MGQKQCPKLSLLTDEDCKDSQYLQEEVNAISQYYCPASYGYDLLSYQEELISTSKAQIMQPYKQSQSSNINQYFNFSSSIMINNENNRKHVNLRIHTITRICTPMVEHFIFKQKQLKNIAQYDLILNTIQNTSKKDKGKQKYLIQLLRAFARCQTGSTNANIIKEINKELLKTLNNHSNFFKYKVKDTEHQKILLENINFEEIMYSDDPPNSLIWPKEKRKLVSQLLLPLTRKKEEIKEKKRLDKQMITLNLQA